MKRYITRAAAAISSAAMLMSLLTAYPAAAVEEAYTPEITGYTDFTVNAYSCETGELFNEDEVMLRLNADTEEGRAAGVGVCLDAWFLTESNPRNNANFPVSPEWTYSFEITWNNYDSYYYVIDYEKTAKEFTLDNSETASVDVYIKKEYKEGTFNSFFVYLGRNSESLEAEFIQFYPVEDNSDVLKKKQLTYVGEFTDDAQYGDIYKTREPVVTTGALYNQYLQPLEHFEKVGNIADEAETVSLRVTSLKTQTGLKPMSDIVSLRMVSVENEEDGYYDYSLRLKDIEDFPYNFNDIRAGDTVEFYKVGYSLVLPAAEYLHVPLKMGDLNSDRTFTIADVVLMQKWLLGADKVNIGDWKSADFCEDGVLDQYDLILMRRALIEELSIPSATMLVDTTYGGYGIAGQDLGHGEYTQELIVRKGDWFIEPYGGDWIKNEPLYSDYTRSCRIMKVTDVTEEGVSFTLWQGYREPEETEHTLAYGEQLDVDSLHVVFDGTNYSYKVSFTDYTIFKEAE